MFERARVPNPPLGTSLELESFGQLSQTRLAQHFAEDRKLRVHGERCGEYFEVAPEIPAQSMLATHLLMSGRTIGYLAAISFSPRKTFDEGQRKLLSIVSDRAAAAIENAKLYENLKGRCAQTLKGLANAIDKMDRSTAGHSTRVAAYAQVLAVKLGLPPERVEIVRQAARLDDIGKIGCVMNLNKPGILTDREYDVFKRHPGFGREI